MSEVGGEDATTMWFESSPSHVVAARRFVRRTLGDSVPAAVSRDLQLIMSELFTNAVQHGHGGRVKVTVQRSAGLAGVSVDSRGRAPNVGPIVDWTVAEPPSVTGRGLGVVRELADEVTVERGDDHFVVTARRAIRQTSDA